MHSKIKQDPYRSERKKEAKSGYKLLIVLILIAVVILGHVRLDIPVETLAQEYANEQSRFLEVDGLDVHYRDEGEGEPLVLLHGWSASLHTWDAWAEILKEDFRVIRLDLPAFGLTGPATDADYSIDYYVDFLDHFLAALDVKESYIAGNSLGGGITWLYAAKHPEKVKKIILLDAAGYKMEMPSITRLAAPEFVRSAIKYITPRYAIRFLVGQVYGEKEKITNETVKRYHRLLLREGNREVLFGVLDRIQDRSNEEVAQLLGSVEIPALIMWGEKDAWIAPELADRFEQDLPDARLITYENAGHIPMEEVPEDTAHDARSFLLE
ncbi:MAG: alpha/beta hydrolase [Firmicutes bacterium]|jgi:pimeloyl-ACP methyl ester carboxylesterase|nr:alpha/beta hydrolase [Bacillota bacterium]